MAADRRLPEVAPRRLLARLRARQGDGEGAMVALLDRADRLFDRLEATAATLQAVAEVELKLVKKLVPIVEDLGELVRLNLEDARDRRAAARGSRRPVSVIDVDDDG